jgi:hypothetical protein
VWIKPMDKDDMMRRNWNFAVTVLAGAALLAAFGAALLIAQGSEDDDRPPIIVHNGSLIFDGGEGANSKTWSKDTFLGEWKPRHDEAKGVRALEVKFVAPYSPAPACASSTLTGEEVRIEYRVDATGNPSAVMRVHLRKKHWFFKKEPKIDTDGKKMTLLEHTSLSPTPPMLVYEDGAPGWISKVTVDGTACEFAKPADETARKAFRVRIQPKKQN